MIDIICGLLLVAGSCFALVAALGVLRMQDLFMRMHAATKAGTLAIGLILLATAIMFSSWIAISKAIVALVFLFITIPLGAHMLGRAAYLIGVPLSKSTVVDEMKDSNS